MKKFYIIPNSDKPESGDAAERVEKYLLNAGAECLVTESIRQGDGTYRFLDPVPKGTDVIITLGGDGTIIQAARNLVHTEIPLFGINVGHLGFLAETDMGHMEESLEALLTDRFHIEERIMLQGQVYRDGKMICMNTGLNDIVLHFYGPVRAIEFEFMLNHEHLNTYFADGMIISTPTGSTAYNLSAGGPIVMPSGEMIVATPINPHAMISRSIVLPGDAVITLRLSGRTGAQAVVNFDSTMFSGLREGDEIEIRQAEEKVKLVKLHKDSFIEVLRTKLEN